MFIRGMRTVGAGIKEELREIIWEKLGISMYIRKIRAVGGGLVIELESMENKIEIMKNKKNLKGVGIWIEDDHTIREREIQSWLEKIVEEERKNGLDAMVGYQKVRVLGVWYSWNEKKGRLEQSSEDFRDQRDQQRGA